MHLDYEHDRHYKRGYYQYGYYCYIHDQHEHCYKPISWRDYCLCYVWYYDCNCELLVLLVVHNFHIDHSIAVVVVVAMVFAVAVDGAVVSFYDLMS